MLTLNTLNEAQRSAVTAGKVPLLVLAGPGSGKTTVVLQRIFYLLEIMKIPPERILALTFTKEAAMSMQERFLEQTAGTQTIFFGTFHSCFYQILKSSGQFRSYSLFDAKWKKQILQEAISKWISKDAKNDVSEFSESISYYKNTGDLDKTLVRLPVKYRYAFLDIYRSYETSRKRLKKIDFDDMVLECRNLLLQDDLIRKQWQNRFDMILLDEFQDINPMQYETMKLLAPPGKCPMFAVGDDDQAIYGFRGASPECLKRFEKEYGAQRITLNVNYRSSENIVMSATRVIGGNKNRYQKHLKAVKFGENGTRVVPFYSAKEQMEYIKEFCTPDGDETYAILFRTNLQMQRYAIYLAKNGFAFRMKENGQSIYNHFVAKDIFAYLSWINEMEDENLFFHFMNKPFRGINRENTDTGPTAIKLRSDLRSLKGKPLFLQLQFLLQKLRYNQYLREKAGNNREKEEEWMMVRDILLEDAGQYGSYEQWKNTITDYQGRKDKEQDQSNSLILMTAHASKGLEFDHVWIPDCNEGIYPHQLLPDLESCEEERRIFYVAMTRAKKSLDLTYLAADKNRSRAPSRFLSGLMKRYC